MKPPARIAVIGAMAAGVSFLPLHDPTFAADAITEEHRNIKDCPSEPGCGTHPARRA